jgi:sodium transport system permease protein
MNLDRTFWIMRKEALEVIRDRRALLGAVLFPLVLVPLVSQVSVLGMSPAIAKYKLAVVNNDNGPLAGSIVKMFTMTNGTEVVILDTVPADIQQKLMDSTYDVAMIFSSSFSSNITNGLRSQVYAMVYPGSTRSLIALSVLQQIVNSFENVLVAQRLASVNLSLEFINPIDFSVRNVGKEGAQEASPLGFMGAFFLVVSAFSAMLGIGMEKSVGEKDKGTLEALLASPASRREIVVGKLLSLLPFGLLSFVATIVGLALGGVITSAVMGQTAGGLQMISLDPSYLPIMLVVAPIFLVQAGALILLVGFFAKTLKEAQTYSGVATFILTVGTIFTFFLPAYISRWICLVPIAGMAVLQNFYMSEGFSAFVLSTILIQILYVALLLALALRVMKAERLVAASS